MVWMVALIPLAASGQGNVTTLGPPHYNQASEAAERLPGQQLTEEGKSLLRTILEGGSLSDLHRRAYEDLGKEAKEFYDSLDDSLAWIFDSKPTPQALVMIDLLKVADEKGLNAEDYDASQWDNRVSRFQQPGAQSQEELIRFDVELTVSAMRYISDLNSGRVSPRLFHFELEDPNREVNLSEYLRGLLRSGSAIAARVRELEPPFPAYQRSIIALKKYRELAKEDDGEALPPAAMLIKPGEPYGGVARLYRLLRLLGDLPAASSTPSSSIYGDSLVEGVKHFQERHGLEPSGLIDRETLGELNTPLSQRVTQIELTLERWRWAPHKFVRPPIVVNIPEFRLRTDDAQYHWVLSMKVVVGKAYEHETPVFASEIRAVVFRPYWNVPLGILRDEFIPKIEENPGYLAENSYEIVSSQGNTVDEDPGQAEVRGKLQSGELGLRQKPGPDNALGLVKFDFPNQFDVYMHGTPATELFSKSRRDFSHGCIRVEDPGALALWVLRDMPEWTAENIRSMMYGDTTFRVTLSKPTPVLIVYGTVVVMENGEVRFFKDIYRQDELLEQALRQKGRTP
ncbi:MAG: L,D-transpeptidase family protein [Candidatus Acidiferrum sp.]